jgi:myo-inositol 2-dehydrogenase/D-chiro-inositol 1-dehydrogenase
MLAHRVPGAALAGVCDVDAVAICSPTPTHADLIVVAAQAGKAIFCEKPLSLSLDELDRALAEVQRAGVELQAGFNRRYDAGHSSVAQAVAGGRIGEAHVVRITSRDPAPPPAAYARESGGLFLDMTVHDFDMARFLTGSDVVEVYAAGSARLASTGAHPGDIDTAVVTLVHANGCLTSIDNSRRATYGFDQRIEVHGSTGMASSDNAARHGGAVRDADGTSTPPLPEFFRERYEQSYIAQWEAFVGALRRGESPSAGPSDARAALVVGLCAWRSLREHRPVRTAEVERGHALLSPLAAPP